MNLQGSEEYQSLAFDIKHGVSRLPLLQGLKPNYLS